MGDTVVLCYHALSEDWPATLNVRPGMFERQIELMVESGYVGSTFGRVVRERPSEKTVVVTFDDAFRSVLTLAQPILARYGIPATVFAVSRFADSGDPLRWQGIDQWGGGAHAGELECMQWDELRDLVALGWEVGSHTVNHPRLTSIDDADLREELISSREACERGLGMPCESIAYPYGDVDARVVSAARSAGYSAGAALPARLHRERELEWPRIGVWWGDDLRRFRLKVSRTARAVRLLAHR